MVGLAVLAVLVLVSMIALTVYKKRKRFYLRFLALECVKITRSSKRNDGIDLTLKN